MRVLRRTNKSRTVFAEADPLERRNPLSKTIFQEKLEKPKSLKESSADACIEIGVRPSCHQRIPYKVLRGQRDNACQLRMSLLNIKTNEINSHLHTRSHLTSPPT